MNAQQLFDELDQLVVLSDMTPTMNWGPPGIGKTEIIRQVARKHGMWVIDERWGQKTPADLRTPVINREEHLMDFYPMRSFPSRERNLGKGIYFLDELTQAHSVMQGIAQQIIHDRSLGDVKLGDEVFVWAAGNRKEDKAGVYDMPTPTANRFYHYEVEPDLDSLKFWWYANNKDPRFMGFLAFCPDLLHKMPDNPEQHAWPSPRSWAMAERRLTTGRTVDAAVGDAVGATFSAWATTVDKLPNTETIAKGGGKAVKFPSEPSLRFAIISSLTAHGIKNFEQFTNVFRWLLATAETEWTSMLVLDVLRILARNNKPLNQEYTAALMKMREAQVFINAYVALAVGS